MADRPTPSSSPATDGAPWLEPAASPTAPVGMIRRSLHLPMRDGVRLAVDVHLPADCAWRGRVPALIRQTRYHRGVQLRFPFDHLLVQRRLDSITDTRRRFVAAGYAWIDVCARGSGASFGHRPCPWSAAEIADGAEVVDWIVAQPWSSGVVGTTGVSYAGTAADFLLANAHPAVKASAPRFSLFDVYPDVAFPGGLHLAWFTERWSRLNRLLDDNRLDRVFALQLRRQLRAYQQLRPPAERGWREQLLGRADRPLFERLTAALLRQVSTGVRPVDRDRAGMILASALHDHATNLDVHQAALSGVYRDDTGLLPELPDKTIDHFSPHAHKERIRASGAAIYSYSGWLDGAYPHSAVKRFLTLRDSASRLILGPWDHGGDHNISPYSPSAEPAFDHDGELLRFFDHHLRGADNGLSGEPPVRYFTVGEERWKSATEWPPAGTRARRYYLAGDRRLLSDPPSRPGTDEHRIDPDTGTGRRSRWRSLLGLVVPAGYSDRAEQGRRLLVYRTEPLCEPLEVTGHPVVTLHLSASADDVALFVYLEEELADGRVRYVTEGQLRALHQKLCPERPPCRTPAPPRTFERAAAQRLRAGEVAVMQLDLLPISWRFDHGHRLRLAIGGADRDHFAPLPGAPLLTVLHGPAQPSALELPVMMTPR